MALSEIAGRLAVSFSEHGFSKVGTGKIQTAGGEERVLLVRPLTFMNVSGQAVSEIAGDFRLSPEDILVLHDDMDIPFGKIRIRRKGSSGGHKGVESVASHLGTYVFPRIKMGIGRPPDGVDPVEFVTSPFEKKDACALEDLIWQTASAAVHVVARGILSAMEEYNGRVHLTEDGEDE